MRLFVTESSHLCEASKCMSTGSHLNVVRAIVIIVIVLEANVKDEGLPECPVEAISAGNHGSEQNSLEHWFHGTTVSALSNGSIGRLGLDDLVGA